ncbi:glycoside hydrolase family 3 C-terminal domain-containing protein [uncultured Oscillibacter sp.]|uniref:glycoside hydrolase family 3 protein n=1 Tax=uncultured Oscillibacter sp. TaxID=876091 RepID=UPI00260F92BE|nr:glycoside hydrolase family 3 protein [uncultured Oscillibacter sp.]
MEKWIRTRYQPNLPLDGERRVTACPEHIALSRQAAQEGMVLLKNRNSLLPLAPGSRVALFGKGSFDYVKGGGGSGDVTCAYVRNVCDGLKEEGVFVYEPLSDYYRAYVAERYAAEDIPGLMAEPELPVELLSSAREHADTAVIVLSRFSGEGWDRVPVIPENKDYVWADEVLMPQRARRIFPKGDYYLTDAESAMVDQVCAAFDRVAVVLNAGGVMDVSWFYENDRISSVLLAYQGGMEGGSAIAALLAGKANPCGKLPDTFARDLDDYPSTEHFHDSTNYVEYAEDVYVGYRYFETLPGAAERVCYPFGFGLSYTRFALEVLEAGAENGIIQIRTQVTNIGDRAGKEVVQLYFCPPKGLLQKPSRNLTAFRKTGLLGPGESETVTLSFAVSDMASFDDLGKIAPSAWVLEKGRYDLYLGTSVRDAEKLDFAWEQAETETVRKCRNVLAPSHLKKRLLADGTWEDLPAAPAVDTDANVLEPLDPNTLEAVAPAVRARDRYLLSQPYPEGVRPLSQAAEGKLALDAFMAQLSDEDLIHLLGGQPNAGVSNTFGIGNLPEYGVPNITTADGPAGLRIQPEVGVCTTAWPCATLLAASWDEELVSKVGVAAAAEVKENNISVWLAPAVNIHRSPLCGRNFEYDSEDPLLAGKIASAMVRGIQSRHIAATVKHFACNNKETNRKNSDSRLSQRALREIYLRPFEIVVREAEPWAIMSSYNIINGRRASESRELLTDILRDDWGYTGMVMTDWWTRGEHYKEILAGNDLKMANGYPERVRQALDLGLVSREDLETCARRVLELILKID